MKKYLTLLLINSLLVALILNNNFLDLFNKINNPQSQSKEYFKKLSLRYYGTDKYGKELAIVNQKVCLKSIKDDIIIPSVDALLNIYETYDMAVGNNITKELFPENDSAQNQITIKLLESSILPPFIGLIIIMAMVAGYFIGRKRSKNDLTKLIFNQKKNSGLDDEKNLINVQNKDEFLINFKQK